MLLLGLAAPVWAAETDLADRIRFHGDADVRWLQVDVDGRSPSGLYGEVLVPGTTFLRRMRLEVTARVSAAVTAGGLVRLSNEPDAVLRLGPDYYGRPEGSAFVAVRTPRIRLRFGYYPVSLTPLTLMRWDEADLGLGGAQSGCGCAGASAAVLLESLERIGPEITFEGARADGSLGSSLDWTVLYARPREAVLDVVAAQFVDMSTFQYHQDLVAARLVYSQIHLPTLTFTRLGMTALHVRDDPHHPTCPSTPEDPLCQAPRMSGLGVDVRVPIGRWVVLEGEWLRTSAEEDVRDPAGSAVWAHGGAATALVSFLDDHLGGAASYLYFEPGFTSPYGALTYVGNREGPRLRGHLQIGPVSLRGFGRRLEPQEREWVQEDRAALGWEAVVAGTALLELAPWWKMGGGYQREITAVDVDPSHTAGFRDGRRDIAQLELGGEVDGFEWRLMQQWIREVDVVVGLEDAEASIATVSVRGRF